MIFFLARRNLRRAASRTLLIVAGVTMSGALLFDMSMLAVGLEDSFAAVLGRLGYEIRVVLHGTLPLSTEALLPDADGIAARIAGHPDVAWASPVLGTNLYAQAGATRTTAVALGLGPEVRGIVTVPDRPQPAVVVNAELARVLALAPGSPVTLSTRISPQTGAPARSSVITVEAIGEFVFDLRAQRTLAVPVNTLRTLMGLRGGDASFLVVKVRNGVDPDAVVQWIEAAFPTLDAFSIDDLLEQAREQLTYFNHFSTILSAVSLLVAVLLIGAVLTLAVGERLGELATLRAVGLTRARLVQLVLLEGLVLAVISVPLALVLGAAVSRPLEAILAATPGIPQDLRFFIPTSASAVRTGVLLLMSGTLGAAYPAAIAGRLNVAATLHAEVQ